MSTNRRRLESALLDAVLNYIGARGWTNYDSFAENLVEELTNQIASGRLNIAEAVDKSKQSFFRLNGITKGALVSGGLEGIIHDMAHHKDEQTGDAEAPSKDAVSRSQTAPVLKKSKLARRKLVPGTLLFIALFFFTIILLNNGVVKLTDISGALAFALVSGMVGALVYGYTEWFERLFGVNN